MNYLLVVIFASLFVVTGCAAPPPPAKEKTQLEIRECQTRSFDVQDHRMVMKSVLNVLQDDGYMVKNVSLDLGFLSATKDIGFRRAHSSSRFDDGFIDFDIFASRHARRRMKLQKRRHNPPPAPALEVIEVTVNVSEFGKNVRVRSSFQSKIFDDRQAVMKVKSIDDEVFYQEFFAKVDKGIFLQQQNI